MGLRALYTVDPTDAGGTQALAHVDVTSVVDGARARILRHHRRRPVPGLAHRPHPAGLLPEGAMT